MSGRKAPDHEVFTAVPAPPTRPREPAHPMTPRKVTMGERSMRRLQAALVFLVALVAGTAAAQDRFITLASTTSTEQSGLFAHIIPLFRQATGLDVRVVAVGTGQALAIGMRGDADALL